MDDCIIISSDEEEQPQKKPLETHANKSTNKSETDTTKPIKGLKEQVKKEAEPSTSGTSDKGQNGFPDPAQAFEEFVAICKNDQDPDMEKILDKMQKYYTNANSNYTSSREFLNFLSCKSNDVLRDPRNIYVFIKEVVDELRQRRSKRIEDDTGPAVKKQKTDSKSDPDEAYKAHKLKLLTKVMEKVKKKIQKLEEQEVNFDDDNDSAYIQLERYKERLVKVFEKICELSGEQKIGQIHRRKIAFTGTNSPEINKCIEKFINKTGQFPDYHDILSLVKTVESEKNKTPEQIRQIATEAFVKAGEQLQLHRRYESWRALSAFLKDESDPADANPELQAQLKKNHEEYSNRIPEVIDKFAEKQTAEKLVAEEVPDEEADQSEGKEEEEDEETEEGEEDENQEKDENETETEFVEKVLSGEISDVSEEEEEEEDRAKNIISLENLEHMDFNGRCGSVSPPTLGEDLNGRLKAYGEKSSEQSDEVVIEIEKDPLSTDKSSSDIIEPIVLE